MTHDEATIKQRALALASAAEELAASAGPRRAPFALAYFTDASRDASPERVAKAMEPGGAVILRDYRAPNREALAKRLQTICAARRLYFLVGDDIALARRIEADGVHFPSWASQTNAPPGLITSAACHSPRDMERAAARGINCCFLSPVFRTESHVGEKTLGPGKFRRFAAEATTPVLALGGVDEKNALSLTGPNVAGFGAIGAFSKG
ncbi:MAG: thiamine phosphate synthase [Marinicaulis sp.]|nr:thiamine phosphate synthase [Marinicaulis sp.]